MEIYPNWNSHEAEFQRTVKKAVKQARTKAASNAVRASIELRSAALAVLRGERSGRVYHKPGTKNITYRASAPSEVPARRSNTLRLSWSIRAVGDGKGSIIPAISTDLKYAPILQKGSSKMEPRPFREPIIERAMPRVIRIFKELY